MKPRLLTSLSFTLNVGLLASLIRYVKRFGNAGPLNSLFDPHTASVIHRGQSRNRDAIVMATSPCSLTQASCVATERCWPQRSRAACQPRIWRGLLRAHRLAPERARQGDAQPAHNAQCRCGRVPVQMWHSPMQMCASPSADVVQTSRSEWRIARVRSSAPQRQSSPVRSATVPSRSSVPAGLHGVKARPR
jgi:hypothetical protein